jgi:two-component system CheB/CheR fusion protein
MKKSASNTLPEDASGHDPAADEKVARPVVGIGASAGGLEALRSLFAELPSDTGATFVVVQHLGRDSESLMPELLAKNTSMPVRFVANRDPLAPDSVFCVPPGASLRIVDDRFRLEGNHERTAPPVVIDTFMRSLAEHSAHRAIGVLLSGTGSDGTLGLGAIRDRGGLTFAQDPEEAEFDAMPRSAVRAGVVDYVAATPDLAEQLVRHLRDADLPVSGSAKQNESEEAMTEVAALLKTHSGHDFALYKPGTIGRRLQRRLRLTGSRSMDEYLEKLRKDGDEPEALFRDLLIGVTDFFRDPDAWDALAEEVIGPLVEQAESSDRPLRIWVPGCATGEEAYTLLMLLEEELGRRGAHPGVSLFATDIDDRALGFAREGLYSEGIADHVSPGRLERFFTREDHHYRVTKRLRERCVFAVHNLLQDAPFSHQDLITCRNLLIYLRPEAQERALSVFQYALRPGGHLMIGSAENLGSHGEMFTAVGTRRHVFQRTDVVAGTPLALTHEWPARKRSDLGTPFRGRRQDAADVRRLIERSVLHDYGPACVLVDAHLDVLQFFGRTSRYLEPSAARGGSNLLEMAPPALRAALWTALGQAASERREVRRTALRPVDIADAEHEFIEVVVRPARELDDGAGLMLVIFRPAQPAGRVPRAAGDGEDDETQDPREVREMEQELRDTRHRLQASIEELEGLNEELQSSNEELLSMNEELQTTKEETQSANEELKTVNAEVESKIDELNRAHADLQNLFHSTEVATVFLNRSLEIKSFTPVATELFRLRDSDTGRPINEVVPRFVVDGGDLAADIERVLETLEPHNSEVQVAEEDLWFTLRIFPYRTLEDAVEGAVLTFTDITDLKRVERQLRLQQEYAERIVESVPEPIAVTDDELRLLAASPSFFERFGFDEATARGTKLAELDGPTWEIAELHRLSRRGTAGDGIQFEIPLDTADGEQGRYLVHARRISEYDGGRDRIILYLADVTAAREREDARDEEVRHKDWFLAMLGHEIRNPLGPIRNALELLREGDADPAYRTRMLAIMERQVDHLTRLVNDMLDISRVTGGKLPLRTSQVDLVLIVTQLAEDHRTELESMGLELVVVSPDASLVVDADPDRLAQAITNLLGNARKYTPRGGRVSMAVGREGAVATVTIADTGIGMAKALLAKVFEPFHKGPRGGDAQQGLGIGLTLARAIIDEHGGDVRAESDGPGRGARFLVRLPLIREEEPGAPAAAARVVGHKGTAAYAESPVLETPAVADADGNVPPGSVSRMRVLLVEDNEDMAATVALVLERLGCDTRLALTGDAALERVRDWNPKVVLCDIGLPGAMSGFDVARAIRASEAGREMRLVAVTGYGRDADREDALAAGFDVFLVKPVEVAALRQAVRSPAATGS